MNITSILGRILICGWHRKIPESAA
ncbi:uncharacterized protein METZ01_LOCUS471167, partial [marine metagenome]